MITPGFPWIEKNPARWSDALRGSHLATAAVGVLAGVGVACARTPIHLPGHKVVLWMVPVLAARIVTRTRAGAAIGASAAAITATGLGGRLAGGMALMPLIPLAGVVLDLGVRQVQRRSFPVRQTILTLGSAGLVGNLICFAKRFFDPTGQSFTGANAADVLVAAGSHALFGFVAGVAGAAAGLALLARPGRPGNRGSAASDVSSPNSARPGLQAAANGSARIRTENQGIMSPLPPSQNPKNVKISPTGGAESGALAIGVRAGDVSASDSELKAVIDAWATLSPELRAAIHSLVRYRS